jgi:hypothetical protein
MLKFLGHHRGCSEVYKYDRNYDQRWQNSRIIQPSSQNSYRLSVFTSCFKGNNTEAHLFRGNRDVSGPVSSTLTLITPSST